MYVFHSFCLILNLTFSNCRVKEVSKDPHSAILVREGDRVLWGLSAWEAVSHVHFEICGV